ncbi:Phosphoglycerate kinase, partial [Biomphalaria glabrata]
HSITKPIPDGMSVVDVGDLSASMFSRIVRKSNIILWCGTVGVTEPVPFVK